MVKTVRIDPDADNSLAIIKLEEAQYASICVSVLAKYGERPSDISLATEDGASNNKAAAKLLRQPFKVCFPHNLQRAVLFSTGMTGKPNQNKDPARAEAGPQRQHDAGRWHLLQAHGCATADGW